MLARDFWKAVTMDRSEFLDRFLGLLEEHAIPFCVIGGQAVNAYVEPVVSLDLDLVVAALDIERVERVSPEDFLFERFVHSLNVSLHGSDLRVQLQLDPRYAAFLPRAEMRVVLGIELPVARLEDVLQGKLWAAGDPRRRSSKRQKDLADIARILEAYPALRVHVPPDVLARLV